MLAAAVAPALIPALIRASAEGRTAGAVALYRAAFGAGLATTLVAALVLGLFFPFALPVLASGFGKEKSALTLRLLLVMLPLLPLTACNVLWRCILNAGNRFVLAALAPVATPLASLAVLYFGAARWGIQALAIGAVAGSAVEGILLAQGVYRLGYPLIPKLKGALNRLGPVLQQFGTILLSSVLFGCIPLIDNAMAAGLAAGSLSVFGFGTKLATVILSLGPASIATGALPQLSRLAVVGDWRVMRGSLLHFGKLILLVTVPIVAVLMLFSGQLVRVVFQKGAFDTGGLRGGFGPTLFTTAGSVGGDQCARIPAGLLDGSKRAGDSRGRCGVAVAALADYQLRRILGVRGSRWLPW